MDSTDTNSKDDKPHDTKGQRASIWQLALPSMLGNLSYTIVGMVQTKFVGDLGTQAIAAVGAGREGVGHDAGVKAGGDRRLVGKVPPQRREVLIAVQDRFHIAEDAFQRRVLGLAQGFPARVGDEGEVGCHATTSPRK